VIANINDKCANCGHARWRHRRIRCPSGWKTTHCRAYTCSSWKCKQFRKGATDAKKATGSQGNRMQSRVEIVPAEVLGNLGEVRAAISGMPFVL